MWEYGRHDNDDVRAFHSEWGASRDSASCDDCKGTTTNAQELGGLLLYCTAPHCRAHLACSPPQQKQLQTSKK